MKNPFKKSSIKDTVVAVGVGGAANVGFDYLYNLTGLSLGETTKNAIKIAGGAIVGSMVSSKIARAAADGIAVVGVSDLIASYMGGSTPTATAVTTGLAEGTINGGMGRIRLGQRGFRRARVAGLAGADFMAE